MSSTDKVKLVDTKVLDQIQEEAWLGFDTSMIKIPDELGNIWAYEEPPGLVLARYLRKPENFGFLCSNIFNVKLMPFQLAVLKEMWVHKFPMMIASRGFGKCITGDSLILTNRGLTKIQDVVGDIVPHTKKYFDKPLLVYGENGYQPVEYAWSNGTTDTLKIETRNGYNLEGTSNHPIRTVRDGELKWINLSDIKIGDYIPICRNQLIEHESCSELSEDYGWFLGSLVGDGGYTVRGRISFTSADEFMHQEMNRIAKDMFDKSFSDTRNGEYSKQLYSVDIWDQLFWKYGFNSSVCAEKDIPTCIYQSSKKTIAAFLSGLFDTDGGWEKNNTINMSSKSKSLVEHVQKLLLLFGIVSRIRSKFNKIYQRDYYNLMICGYENIDLFNAYIGFRLDRKSTLVKEYLKSGIVGNTNLDILPHDLILETLLKLREKYYALEDRPKRKHDDTDPFSVYSFKTYQPSYAKLRGALEFFKLCEDTDEWQFLNDLLNKHYYYDKVTKIEQKENITYDLYVPNDHSFISNGFISHNSFLLSLYSMMRALLHPNHKVVIAGAGFRQSKHLFAYTEVIWNRSPVLRSLCRGSDRQGPRRDIDRCTMQICDSTITFLPVGSGGTIRGERAHTLIVDEFSVLPLQIYEVVLRGFTSTSSDPVRSSIEYRTNEILKERYGIEIDKIAGMGNQSIISGTCDYDFQHFATYWKRYKQIIESKGDTKLLGNVDVGLDETAVLDYKDFSVIRIPYNLLPAAFMDAGSIASSRATMNASAFLCEYGACFSKDSDGFFKRSLLDACTFDPNASKDTYPPDAEMFEARTTGNPERKYVYGIDPASESDNFSIVILELHQNHTRIVYCWTTNKKEHKVQLKAKLTTEQNFYAYVVRKVRQLMKTFPPAKIGCDAQGGGVGVREAFYDQAHIEEGELPIFPVPSDDPAKPNDTDLKAGLHIVEYVQFAKADWTTEANTFLRKDFENKLLLFPYFDTASLEMAAIDDQQMEEEGKLKFDSLENIIWEIEELKSELATIVETKTAAQNRSHWDTPEIKLPNNKKGRMRKDRYSALVIANMLAHSIQRTEVKPEYRTIGGFAHSLAGKGQHNEMFYTGPQNWVDAVQDFFS